jgi:hypothetical protein
VTPKPLSKTKEETLRAVAKGRVEAELTPRLAREILAALEYERFYGAEATRTLEDIGANGPEHTFLWAKAKARISLARLRRG